MGACRQDLGGVDRLADWLGELKIAHVLPAAERCLAIVRDCLDVVQRLFAVTVCDER